MFGVNIVLYRLIHHSTLIRQNGGLFNPSSDRWIRHDKPVTYKSPPPQPQVHNRCNNTPPPQPQPHNRSNNTPPPPPHPPHCRHHPHRRRPPPPPRPRLHTRHCLPS